MKKFTSLVSFLLFTITCSVHANDQKQLHHMLNDFLTNTEISPLLNHQQFWADDLIYTSSAGKRFGKSSIIEGIKASSGQDETNSPKYTAENVDIRVYGKTAIIAFKLVATSEEDNKVQHKYYFNTGTLLKRNDTWQVIAWQATKIPSDNTDTAF